MANPEQPAIQVRVVAGWTEKGRFVLTPGTKPVSVGTQGQWIIVAEGVAPVHLYFAFDGATAYVAPASPAQTVLLAGTPIGAGWAVVAVPSEIRFGGAKLMLEPSMELSLSTSSAPSSPSTVSDGGALWEAAQRAVQAAQATAPLAPRASSPPEGAAHPLGPLASTIVMVPNPGAALLLDALGAPPAGAGTVAAPSGPGFAPMPQTPQRWSVPPAEMSTPGHTSMPPPTNEAGLPPDWGRPLDQSSPATTEPEPPRGFWKSTSGPKKATLLLMPLVLLASYYLLVMDPARRPEPAKAKPATPVASTTHPPAPSASALAKSASPGPSSSAIGAVAGETVRSDALKSDGGNSVAANQGAADTAGGAASAPGIRAGRLAPIASKPGAKTPERAALDDVAAGSFDDAAKEYDALAAQHPEDLVLRDAARILHQKASRYR